MPNDETRDLTAPPAGTVVRTPTEQARGAAQVEVAQRYEVVRKLGQGGMGAVYLARDRALNREVAVKTLVATDARPEEVARFWAEAEVMAAVKHPHVVQVYELGRDVERPYMVMEYLPNGSLFDLLKEDGALPPHGAAAMIERIARGVAAAHDLGIVHRDLKPANVLLTDDDEPKVTDFGIAKRAAVALTGTQAMMGTPHYMAPELAAGRAKFVGPPADVWALGVMLFECAAGAKPFSGETVLDVLAKIATESPPGLRAAVPTAPHDLAVIVAKCMSKEPELRYPTAGELADDLGRFARGEPIQARPAGAVERAVRWARRKPTVASAYGVGALAVALAAVAFVLFGFWRAAERAKDTAERAKGEAEGLFKEADSARGEALRQKGIAENAMRGEAAAKMEAERERERIARIEYGRATQVVYQLWKDNKLREARTLLGGTRADLRRWEYAYVQKLCHADVLTLEGHAKPVNAASFSPDGSKVVTASDDGTVRVWDGNTGRQLAELKAGGEIRAASFDPTGSRVVIGGGTVRVWDWASGAVVAEFKGHAGLVMATSFGATGIRQLVRSDEKTVQLWSDGRPVAEFKGHTAVIYTASFSADGRRVVTGGNDLTARVWDAATGQSLAELKGHTGGISSASFSPTGRWVVTGAWGGQVRVWDSGGKMLAELKGSSGGVSAASFSPEGARVVTASEGVVRVWAAATGAPLAELKGHSGWIHAASFSPDGTRVVTCGDDRTARVWDVADKTFAELKGHTGMVFAAAFSRDGSRVVTTGGDNTARVWEAATGWAVTRRKGDFEWVSVVKPAYSASFGAGGAHVVTPTGDSTAKVWEAATGRTVAELKGHTGFVRGTTFSADGRRVVTASSDRTARVWDAAIGKTVAVLEGHTDEVNAAAFSPDGARVVTAGWDKVARVWDAATGRSVLELRGHTAAVVDASYSPDGSQIVTASSDGTARVWEAGTGKTVALLKGHTGQVSAASFSPDGARVATASSDGTARVWDASGGAEVLTLPGGQFAAFSPDGHRLLTGGGNTPRIYDARPVNRAFLPPAPKP